MEKPILKLNALPAGPKASQNASYTICGIAKKLREKRRSFIFALAAFVLWVASCELCESRFRGGEIRIRRYASLAFSDWSSVMSIWKLFALSLAETAPLLGVALGAFSYSRVYMDGWPRHCVMPRPCGSFLINAIQKHD